MAIALLLTTALALVGFLVASVQGFGVGTAETIPQLARMVVARHVGLAIPTVLLSLFSQSMVIFYFIGTGKLVRLEVAEFPDAERGVVLRAVSRFKRHTSPPATFSILAAIGVFVSGGAVHTAAAPAWTHGAAAAVAVALHLWAIVAEWRAFSENATLMSDPRRWARDALRSVPS